MGYSPWDHKESGTTERLSTQAPHADSAMSIPAGKIPWTEEPGRLQSMGSLRVGHD